jgi:hypothetical protein
VAERLSGARYKKRCGEIEGTQKHDGPDLVQRHFGGDGGMMELLSGSLVTAR